MEIWGLVFQHLGSILSVVLILAILSGKNEARTTLGWVLFVLFLPFVGALVYLVFGRAPWQFPASQELASTPFCPLPPEGLPEPVERTMKLTAKLPTLCSRLELLPGADVKYRRLEADIEAASRRVVLCYYVFRRDRTGSRLLDLLARKASTGVEVCLLYDGWAAFGLAFADHLRPYVAKGVRARAFHPVVAPLQMSRIDFRNHRKIAVIDGEIAYTGSINIGDEYLGQPPRLGTWRDAHARLEGAAAWALESVFLEDWRAATGEILAPSPPPADPGDTWVHIIPSGPSQVSDALFPVLFAQFASAKKGIDLLTPYLVPDQGLLQGLRVAARSLPRRLLEGVCRRLSPVLQFYFVTLLQNSLTGSDGSGAKGSARSIIGRSLTKTPTISNCREPWKRDLR